MGCISNMLNSLRDKQRKMFIKTVAIFISFIFLFESAGYSFADISNNSAALRPPMGFANKKVTTNVIQNRFAALGILSEEWQLLAHLQSNDWEVRADAVRKLSEYTTSPAVADALIIRLSEDMFLQVRMAAAFALAKFGNFKICIDALIIALNDDPRICYAAAQSLGIIGNKAAVEPLLERLNQPINTSFFSFYVYSGIAFALGCLRDPRAVEPLSRLLSIRTDDYVLIPVIEALEKIGDDSAIPALERMLVTKSRRLIYDKHGQVVLVAGRAFNNTQKAAIRALKLIRESKSTAVVLPDNPPKGLRVDLVRQALKDKRIPLSEIKDEKTAAFLKFLRDKGLRNIFIMGGGIRDIFFGLEPNDFDITIGFALTEEEVFEAYPSIAPAPERAYMTAMRELGKLATALGIKIEDFQRPSGDPNAATFDGREVQYAGPIQAVDADSISVLIKRIFIDTANHMSFSSYTGPGLLQMAIDCDGNLYGKTDSLYDLLSGRASISGDGDNFSIGGILRLLRLKHQFGLYISDKDYALMRNTLEKYKTGELKISNLLREVSNSVLNKLLDNARDRESAYRELNDLEIIALLFDPILATSEAASTAARESL